MANDKVIADPRQSLALSFYRDPTSETFGDLKNSMLRANYDEDYADSIHGRKPMWLTEAVKNDVLLVDASQKNLKRYATMHVELKTKNDIEKAKIQVNVSQFVLKTIGKKKWGEGEEQSSPSVQINIVNYNQAKPEPVVKEAETKQNA